MSCDFENTPAERRTRGLSGLSGLSGLWGLAAALLLVSAGAVLSYPGVGISLALPRFLPAAETAVGLLAVGIALAALSGRALWRSLAQAHDASLRAEALSAMLEHDEAARLLVDAGGAVRAANAQARRLWPSLDPVAETRARLFDPHGLAGLEESGERLERLDAAARTGQSDRATLALRPGAGRDDEVAPAEPEWWDISLRILPAGDHPWRLWVAHDVTARRAIDEVMTREREALSEALFLLPVGLYTSDTEGRLRFLNQRLARWLEQTETDLGQMRLADIVDAGLPPPEDGDWQGEMRFRTATGESFPALVCQASFDDGGDLLTRAVVIRDAAAASDSGGEVGAEPNGAGMNRDRRSPDGGPWRWDRMFRWLFDGAPVGIILTDPEGCLSDCNRALEQLLGQTRGDLVDRPLPDLMAPADRETVARVMDQVLKGDVTRGVQIDVALASARDQDGRPVTAALFLGPMGGRRTGPRGVPVEGVIAHLIDTSEQRSLERQFAQAQKMQAMGQLAGGVAHDFNNLLTAMIGYSDLLLQRHGTGDPSFADIMQIRQNANRAANLVRQLLAFSRRQPLQPRAVDVGAALSELSHLLRRLLGETVRLEVVHGRDVDCVRADPGQFDQVIINLAVNARDAMTDGGTLTIATRLAVLDRPQDRGVETMPPGEYVVIEVRDTGKGIPPEHVARIFEPFFTTKGGGAVGAGTGLGLSTVYGILRQTGGFIDVESAPGQGTTFCLHLPRVIPEPAAIKPAAADGSSGQAGGVADEPPRRPADGAPPSDAEATASPTDPEVEDLSGAGTILLVEDEAPVRTFAARALRNKGYTVLEAATGEAALEMLADAPPLALLITDMVMPGVDGATLARAAQDQRPDLRVIIISGYSEDSARGDILERPHIHFLPKPFSLKLLAETVKSVLSSPG